jgi:hypothetical protein
MTNPERIYEFLTKKKGSFFCDDCLTKEVGLARRQEAQQTTSALATTLGFERRRGCCSQCRCEKFVIRAKPCTPRPSACV